MSHRSCKKGPGACSCSAESDILETPLDDESSQI